MALNEQRVCSGASENWQVPFPYHRRLKLVRMGLKLVRMGLKLVRVGLKLVRVGLNLDLNL